MNGALQSRIAPHSAPNMLDIGAGTVRSANPPAVDSTGGDKVDFRSVLLNSNAEIARERAAKKNGDDLSAAKTDEEFFRMLSEKTNPNRPKPAQQELDKEAFLKLFITQLQNQDPLNPDDSAKMAAQLAQFQSLEQTMNINKTLEKMTKEQALGRAVNLVDFVGKEVKLEGGKLRFAEGKVTDAVFEVEKDAPKAILEVRDASGAVIGTKDLGYLTKGTHVLDWDGTGKDGNKVKDGTYTFAIVATDGAGNEVPVKISSTVTINGVDLQDEGGSFYTEIGKVSVAEVASVGDNGFVRKAITAVNSAPGNGESEAQDAAGADASSSNGEQESTALQEVKGEVANANGSESDSQELTKPKVVTPPATSASEQANPPPSA